MEAKHKKLLKELMTKTAARRETGLYIVDGPKMCSEIPPEEIEELFVTETFLRNAPADAFPAYPGAGAAGKHGWTVIGENEMKQISDTVTPQGILAVVRQKKKLSPAELIRDSGRNPFYLVLETVQDPGNVGTIFRAGEAAGVSGIFMNRCCADLYAPKVVRSTMGSVFRVPFAVAEDLAAAAEELKAAGVSCVAAHLKGKKSLYETDLRTASAAMIGNESRGLSRELTEKADRLIRIPMCGSVESLNAAMAAAVISFEAMRQRSASCI